MKTKKVQPLKFNETIKQLIETAKQNLSCPSFDISGKGYYRNDIRRFLSPTERKTLSRTIGKAYNYHFLKPNFYRVLCRNLGNITLTID